VAPPVKVRGMVGARFAGRAATVAPLPVDGEAPGHAHQPRAKPLAVPKVAEAAVGFDERLLRHVLGVLPVPQHAIRDAEGQRGRFDEPGLELLLELLIHAYDAAGKPVREPMHPTRCKTPQVAVRFGRGSRRRFGTAKAVPRWMSAGGGRKWKKNRGWRV